MFCAVNDDLATEVGDLAVTGVTDLAAGGTGCQADTAAVVDKLARGLCVETPEIAAHGAAAMERDPPAPCAVDVGMDVPAATDSEPPPAETVKEPPPSATAVAAFPAGGTETDGPLEEDDGCRGLCATGTWTEPWAEPRGLCATGTWAEPWREPRAEPGGVVALPVALPVNVLPTAMVACTGRIGPASLARSTFAGDLGLAHRAAKLCLFNTQSKVGIMA